jgi:hypothetical protein
MTAFNPITSPRDYIVLSGKRSPGTATLSGWSDLRNFDERMGYALSGATLIYKGAPLCRGKVTLTLWEDQHFDDWETFRVLLRRPQPPSQAQLDRGIARPRPIVLDIEHPQLAQLGVRRVVVKEVGQLEEADDLGSWAVTIDLLEYRPPTITAQRAGASRAAQEQMDARDFIMLGNSVQEQAELRASGIAE